jgi:hypothetical protein
VAQVVISWALQSHVVIIPRSSKPQHIAEYSIFYYHGDNNNGDNNNNNGNGNNNSDSNSERVKEKTVVEGRQGEGDGEKLKVFLDAEDMALIDGLDGSIQW